MGNTVNNVERIEYLSARIEPKHLNTGGKVSPKMLKRNKMMGKVKGDDTGHVIANRLGGAGDDAFNFFPQRININRGIYRLEETKVAEALKSGKASHVDMKFNFKYNDQFSTRPNSFIVDFDYYTSSGTESFTRLFPNRK
jgi:hypothetical protein